MSRRCHTLNCKHEINQVDALVYSQGKGHIASDRLKYNIVPPLYSLLALYHDCTMIVQMPRAEPCCDGCMPKSSKLVPTDYVAIKLREHLHDIVYSVSMLRFVNKECL